MTPNGRSATVATFLSFLWPGLGDFYVRRRLRGLVWALPPALLLIAAAAYVLADPTAFAVNLLAPAFALVVIAFIAAHGLWRVAAIIETWRLTRGGQSVRSDGALKLAVAVSLAVVLVHVTAGVYVEAFGTAGGRIFVGDRPAGGDVIDQILGGNPTPTPTIAGTPSQGDSPLATPTPGSSPTHIPGDCNGDGVVNGNDILPGDTNGDCVVDQNDDPQNDVPDSGDAVTVGGPPGPQLTPPPLGADVGTGTLPASGPINVLFVGIDSGLGRDHALTDTLLVASYYPERDKLVMISIPRDTGRVPLYVGGLYPNRINTFLNYAKGNSALFPEGPIAALLKEVGYILGTNIPFYAATNLDGLPKAVDAVGGVDVVLTTTIADPTWPLYLQPGPYHLTGETVMPYVRSRHGPGNSDYLRALRQQDVLMALAAKAQQPSILLNLPDVIDAISQVVRTNVPRDNTTTLLTILRRANDASTEHIVLSPPQYTQRIPPAEVGGRWMLQFIMPAVRDLSLRVFGPFSSYN